MVAATAVLLLNACQSGQSGNIAQAVDLKKKTTAVAQTAQTVRDFEDWKAQFKQRAIAAGYQPHMLARLIDAAQENPRIVAQDRKQPEFAKMPWEYLDSAVTAGRIQKGREHYQANADLLNRFAQQSGVPAEIITAIWGIESGFGANTGNADLVNALATLAFEGRRREFAEQQLLALLDLLQRDDVEWSQLQGSWAGGMGHTQFIPATWRQYGSDGDGDGRRNPWQKADALASTAHYLGSSGWIRGLPWGYEVQLPQGFDAQLIGQSLPLSDWARMGLVSLSGENFAALNQAAELWLPAGVNGPALLLTKNFRVIRVYNNSSSYALAVALLGDGIAGRAGLQSAWPRHEKALSRAQVQQLQNRLTQIGYDTKGSDGILGNNTRNAFALWQAANGQVPDGFISQGSAASLLQ